MGLSPAQETVLEELVATVPAESWRVFGSVDSVLRGLEDDPGDVDVLATAAGADRIREAFAEDFVRTRELGRSQVDEYRRHGEEVEVIYSDPAKEHQEPLVDLERAGLERTADRGVPQLPLARIVDAYRQIGKEETATRLADRLDASD